MGPIFQIKNCPQDIFPLLHQTILNIGQGEMQILNLEVKVTVVYD